ncbi:MAG TPA: hypothetical protein VLT35_03315, partial [Methanocella sp.]|nr:hypothetical protein [Methanocella sp.]
MRSRLHRTLLVSASAMALLAFVILVSGCILSDDGSRSATLTPPAITVSPVPASLFLDPPVPGVTKPDVIPPASLPEPASRVPYLDPAAGTRLARATDRQADVSSGDPSRGLGTESARAQAFAADGSRFLVRGTGDSWYLYDGQTLLPEGRLPFTGAVEPRWGAADPGIIYYV